MPVEGPAPEQPDETEPKKDGRPTLKLNMKLLAHYLHYGEEHFSINTARDQLSPVVGFDVTRGLHNLHKKSAAELQTELEALRI